MRAPSNRRLVRELRALFAHAAVSLCIGVQNSIRGVPAEHLNVLLLEERGYREELFELGANALGTIKHGRNRVSGARLDGTNPQSCGYMRLDGSASTR